MRVIKLLGWWDFQFRTFAVTVPRFNRIVRGKLEIQFRHRH